MDRVMGLFFLVLFLFLWVWEVRESFYPVLRRRLSKRISKSDGIIYLDCFDFKGEAYALFCLPMAEIFKKAPDIKSEAEDPPASLREKDCEVY